jgi:hypothetical protein
VRVNGDSPVKKGICKHMKITVITGVHLYQYSKNNLHYRINVTKVNGKTIANRDLYILYTYKYNSYLSISS